MQNEDVVTGNVRKAIVLLIGLVLVAVVAGMLLEAQIAALSERLIDRVGPIWLGIIVALNDFVISPFPPDLLLLVLSKSPGARDLFGFVALLGLASALGGTMAWCVSRRWGRPAWLGPRFDAAIAEHHSLISRYGAWAVGIAALTPVPFSLVCWLAGFVNLEFTRFAPMTLLRIPRFVAYYVVLVFSEQISGWLRVMPT